jgi:hypothetical protein
MRALLAFATAAIIALPAPPALADHRDGTSFSARSGDPSSVSDFRFGRRDGDRRHHRRHHGGGDILYIDREYQGDTAWRADSFNDWWHDQPNRSFPRWMQNNGNCDRQWWGGDQLRC